MKSIHFLLTAVFLIVINYSSLSWAAALNLNTLENQCVFLKNAHYKEYLFNEPTVNVDNDSNQVFTWRTPNAFPPNKFHAVWLLTKEECIGCYSIKSVVTSDYNPSLYAVSSANSEFRANHPRRPVHAYHVDNAFPEGKGDHIWKIEKSLIHKNRLRIQSKIIGKPFGEFLYAGKGTFYDRDQRHVYTWSSKEDSEAFGEHGEWIMEKADCPSHIVL